jgi:hypothetical protein
MEAPTMENLRQILDITGNWSEFPLQRSGIQVREPWIQTGEGTQFKQKLQLPKGHYQIEFTYNPLLDKKPGSSISDTFINFEGLKMNGSTLPLDFVKNEESGTFTGRCEFDLSVEGDAELTLALYNTRVMQTRLICCQTVPLSSSYVAVSPEKLEHAELCLIRGIPFATRKITSQFFPANLTFVEHMYDVGELHKWTDQGMHLDCSDSAVDTAYFLGMIHSYDIANGSWYSENGDHGYSHFVGDRAGDILINWSDGETSILPLIFGYNVWFSRPWDMLWHYSEYVPGVGGENFDDVLFTGMEDDSREIIRDSLRLTDGMRVMGSNSSNARYIFAITLGGRKVKSLRIQGNPEMHGFPVVSAVTLKIAEESKLPYLPLIKSHEPEMPSVRLDSIDEHLDRQIPALQRLLYTFTDDLPDLAGPEIPDGYFGPSYNFSGTREAVYAATYLYYNGPECAAYIADSGTGCSSSTSKWAIPHYTLGIGIWLERKPWEKLPPHLQQISRKHKLTAIYEGLSDWFKLYQHTRTGQLPGLDNAWTRGAGELLREAMAFGYGKFVDNYTDWLDAALFSEARPPHWNRIAGDPTRAAKSVEVGDTLEYGNRENDGHGICMWGRYMVWHWQGRLPEWNMRRWEATKASVNWISWQLDNDTLYPGVRKDVLYTQSECAKNSYDIYSSYNCLHGIKLCIGMAEQLGEHEEAQLWNALFHRLRNGILEHLVDSSPQGDIWHTEPDCDWADHAHKLVHLLLATEGDTYTPLQDYVLDEVERRFLQIDINSYRFLMIGKNYDYLRMYGYGQGFMTQAALLLDQMEDAEKFLQPLVSYCYLPRMGRWASPEGMVVHRSGKFSVPVKAYMGQDSHVADSTKAVRLMLGVDDNNPEHLRLIPRFPHSWTQMSISDFPVLTGNYRQNMQYEYERADDKHTFIYGFEHLVEHLSIRLGPLPKQIVVLGATYNQMEHPFELLESGDCTWVWIHQLSGKDGSIELFFAPIP